MRIASLIRRKQPEDLLAGLLELRQLMLNTLKSKDEVAKAFEDYLNGVDDDYLRLNQEQANEVDEIIQFSRKSIKELQKKSLEAVKECQKAFDEERERFIKESEDKLDKLRQEIADVETKAIETRQSIAAEHADNL